MDNNLVLPDNYSSSNLFSSVFENSTSSNNNIDGESLLDEQEMSLLGFNFSLCLIPEVIQTPFLRSLSTSIEKMDLYTLFL